MTLAECWFRLVVANVSKSERERGAEAFLFQHWLYLLMLRYCYRSMFIYSFSFETIQHTHAYLTVWTFLYPNHGIHMFSVADCTLSRFCSICWGTVHHTIIIIIAKRTTIKSRCQHLLSVFFLFPNVPQCWLLSTRMEPIANSHRILFFPFHFKSRPLI